MKYFNNITSKEELKKKFREYCVTMHPDKGGNAEEFKAMVAEYNEFNANFERIAQQQAEEEEARKRAEEYRKAEEERKRKEEEEARKAAEALQGIIAKWSSILEAVGMIRKILTTPQLLSAILRRYCASTSQASTFPYHLKMDVGKNLQLLVGQMVQPLTNWKI